MDANVSIPDGDKNKLTSENKSVNQPLSDSTKIVLSVHALNRLARILADIAENPQKANDSSKPKQDDVK